MDGLPTLNERISREETLRIIDESIAKQQKAIDELFKPLLALRSQRNAIVPISRLPPELICRIFSFAQVPDPEAYKPKPLEWINLTYVCRHWRNIAVNSPSLWVIPPIGYHKWVEEMLERSKGSSLVIRSNTSKTPIESGLVPALQQIHRIEELSLRNFNSESWNSVQEMLMKSVPRLERLFLGPGGVDTDTGWGWGQTDPQPLVIWEDILCKTERLRQLELDYCQLNWDSHSYLFRSLTHLKLKDLPQNSLPNGKQLVNTLKGMPDLEVLDLWKSLPNQTGQQSSWGSENIHLTHLRSLSINSEYVEVEAFFHCVTFPPTAYVKIICLDNNYLYTLLGTSVTNQDTNFSGVIFALARSYSTTTLDTTFHSLSQHRGSDTGFHLMFFTETLNFNEIMGTTAVAHLELTLSCSNSGATRRLMTDIFDSSIPLHDINCVYICDSNPGLDSETIANTLGLKLPRLHSVIASGHGARNFFNALDLGVHVRFEGVIRSGETPNQALYFPCVSSIGLDDIDFVDTEIPGDPEYLNTLSIELLQNSLIQRCELGAPIERLFLQNCRGIYDMHGDTNIKALEEIVVNVDWELLEMADMYLADMYSPDEREEIELEEDEE